MRYGPARIARRACRREAHGEVGACWAFVRERLALFHLWLLSGRERWRVDVFFALLAFGAGWMLWLDAPRRGLGAIYFFIVLAGRFFHSAARAGR